MRIFVLLPLLIVLGGCAKDNRPICPSCGERATMIMHPRMPEIAEMGWAQTHYKCENQHNFTKDGELVDVFGNPLKKKKPLAKADPKFSGDKLVPENSVKKALIPTEDIGTDWTELNYDDFVWLDVSKVDDFGNEVGGGIGYARNKPPGTDTFDPYICLDLEEQMRSSSSVYLRMPFVVEDKSRYIGLTLGARVDDGFVAYLNGHKVVTFKAPTVPLWNSMATTSNLDSIAITMVDHSLNCHMNKLVNGPNILAIQALNLGRGSDFLFSCQLEGITSETTPRKAAEVVSDNPNLKYNITGDAVTITGCDKKASCALTIPETIQGKTVTSIGVSAFSSCNKLTSITIPDGITNIGVSAFSRCSSLTTITIPDSVTSIGAGAFYACSGLTSITIPDGVTSIGDNTFYACSGLTSITIPDGVASIGDNTFRECTGLTSITIPDGVTSIGDNTFRECKRLTSITIPDGVTSIGISAFFFCNKLTSITIPDSVTSIGRLPFENCNTLTSITVGPGSLNYKDVGGVLFNKEKTILHAYPAGKKEPNYTIPDSVTRIEDLAFGDCTSLTSITIGDSVTSIGNFAFSSCNKLTSITIPDSVTSIGNYAFRICTMLTSITIGDSVTSIGNYAFAQCTKLTSITIPDGVTSIGGSAFWKCSSLTAVTFLGDAPKEGENIFYAVNATIYRKPDAKGWGDTWGGRRVKLISEKP